MAVAAAWDAAAAAAAAPPPTDTSCVSISLAANDYWCQTQCVTARASALRRCASAAAKSAAPLPLSRRRSPRPPRPPRPPQRPRRRRSPPLTPRRSRPARPPRRRRTVARNAGAPAATSLASALTRPRARASAGWLACGRARAASSSRRAMSNLQTAATAAAPIITAASRTSHPSGNSWGAQRFRAPPLMPRRRLRSSPHGRLRRS